MTVFFDTNVLVAAFLSDGVCRRLLSDAIAGRIQAMVSEQVLSELERHLHGKFRVPQSRTRETLLLVRGAMQVVPDATFVVARCRDPDDDAILATAEEHAVEYLVTGDKDLLVLRVANLDIVTPGQLLRLLER